MYNQNLQYRRFLFFNVFMIMKYIINESQYKKLLKEEEMTSKYWVVGKDKRGELYVFNDGYYNTKEEAEAALKNITVPKIVDANTIKVEAVPTKPDYTVLFNNLSK